MASGNLQSRQVSLNIFNNDDLVRFSTRKRMIVIDDQVGVNEINSWVSTKEYEEYVL